MKIVSENDLACSRDRIVDASYKVCQKANFPVNYDDVYNHLFGSNNSVPRFLLDNDTKISGFAVAENYKLLTVQPRTITYLQGMVISNEYQGKGYSHILLKDVYKQLHGDFLGLRTQNFKMAKSLINLFEDPKISIPMKEGKPSYSLLEDLKTIYPYQNIDDSGIVRNCYYTQLYPDLEELKKINPSIILKSTDALAVVVEPQIKMSEPVYKKHLE